VELIDASFLHIFYYSPHLSGQEHIQFGVEVVDFVLVEALELSFLSEVFLHNPDNSFLHFLLQNVVLARSIDIIQKLLSLVVVVFDLIFS